MLWSGSERLEYIFFKAKGLTRRVAEISEELGSEKSNRIDAGRDGVIYLRLVGALYPTKYLYAKIASELLSIFPGNAAQMTVNAETGLNFEKLKVSLNYGRAYKESEDALGSGDVKEERWDLKVAKTF